MKNIDNLKNFVLNLTVDIMTESIRNVSQIQNKIIPKLETKLEKDIFFI